MNMLLTALLFFFVSVGCFAGEQHYVVGMLKTNDHILYVLSRNSDDVENNVFFTVKDTQNNTIAEAISTSTLAMHFPSLSKMVKTGLANQDASLWPLHTDKRIYMLDHQRRSIYQPR